MTNITRNEKKYAAKKEARKANNIAELELVFTIGALYIVNYYEKRPVRRFFAKMGIRCSAISTHYMDRAKEELSNVDYKYDVWLSQYNTDGIVKA